jgi:hypothetical protein
MAKAKHEEGQIQPTPTQDELDRAMMGEHVIDKEHDGSEIQNPPPEPPPPDELNPQKKKQMEAKPASGGGYQTRQATAAPAAPAPTAPKTTTE